ncbi:branched-chain amino acid ABC transporter permease [Ferrovibrio sp.]|uniref:branched-chain amino acid ABC transporter permease n=1 Tax=Ferrovibrio sp. TaxID=1917215 RepID=UPI001B76DE93|nr:branched-chain amino acid ABC transporter permease [Ferrovibrio sp.]MBP7063694.1 branched-chain amino acid ABC transporter permease [Ferrovibrio sp.]
MPDSLYLLQLLLNGLVLGLIYALIAAGLSLLFGVLEMINFAHGEFLMLGAYAMCFTLPLFGLSYLPSLALSVLLCGGIGLLLFEGFLSRVQRGEFERGILITMGLSMILLYGMQYAVSATPRMVDTQFGFSGVAIGDIQITWARIAAAGFALLAFGLLYWCLNATEFGRCMRAIAQSREAALMVGIQPKKVARNAVMLATALCGLAGACIAPVQLVQPQMGQFLVFKAFALVLIGGLGSIPGAITAAVLLGVVENFVGGFFSIVWQEAVGFIAMILVLILRPEGLFARGNVRVG